MVEGSSDSNINSQPSSIEDDGYSNNDLKKDSTENTSEEIQGVKLEELSQENEISSVFSNNKEDYNILHHEQVRKTYKAKFSLRLAQSLWIGLAITVGIHLCAVVAFSALLIRKPHTDDKEEYSQRIKDAISSVNETSKTLYTFLTPLATAVTGYYFSTISSENNSNDN